MGSGLSKHPDELKADLRKEEAAANLNAADPPTSRTVSSAAQQPEEGSAEQGGCPMKRGDGSYSFDWKAAWRSGFPHGPQGSKPLTPGQAAAASSSSQSEQSSSPSATEETGGCPVKSKSQSSLSSYPEYNVYSQPIVNSANQMPQVANQLPAPSQTKALSTDRVSSSIPKVSVWCFVDKGLFPACMGACAKCVKTLKVEPLLMDVSCLSPYH
jgi:hypothetical protein